MRSYQKRFDATCLGQDRLCEEADTLKPEGMVIQLREEKTDPIQLVSV